MINSCMFQTHLSDKCVFRNRSETELLLMCLNVKEEEEVCSF